MNAVHKQQQHNATANHASLAGRGHSFGYSTGSSSPRSMTSSNAATSSMSPMQSNVGVPQPSEEELAGRSYLDWLKDWDDAQVSRWLNDNRCGTHASTFASNDIRGNVLLDVDQQALKEMGVQSVGDRMRIVVAIKKLRQACVAHTSSAVLANRRPLQHSSSIASLNGNSMAGSISGSAPASPTAYNRNSAISSAGAVVTQAQIIRRPSNGKSAHRIPPPLHLAQSSVADARLPQAYQSTPVQQASGHVSSGSISGVAATYGARSSSNNASLLAAPGSSNYAVSPLRNAASPRSGMSPHPPALPPPQTQPPPPPSSQSQSSLSSVKNSGSRGQLAAPTISTTAASPTNAVGVSSWGTSDHNGMRARPIPLQGPHGQQQYWHRKAGSTGGSISSSSSSPSSHPYAMASHQGRPSTAQAAYQQHHPFAGVSGSPTSQDGISYSGSANSLSGRLDRPGTAPHDGRGHHSKTSHGSLGLSPISEGYSAAPSPVNAEHPQSQHASSASSSASSSTLKAQQQNQGYTVGKGGFARPTTAAGTVSIPSGSSQAAASGQVIPFEEVMRKTVKFIGDDGISKMVYVDGAKDTYEVLLRTLRKFGKLAMNRFPEPNKGSRNEYGELYAEMEGYRVFAGKADGSARALTESELFAICQSATRPERARGLIIRKPQNQAQVEETNRFTGKARKLRNFFGEDPNKSALSPTSPNHILDISMSGSSTEEVSPAPSSPSSNSEGADFVAPTPPHKAKPQRNTMNRASTVSIMSGLNWGSPAGTEGVSSAAQMRSPSAGFIPSQTQKLRSFFGHRPPSELISTHLVDYFPSAPAEKKILSKAVRNNVRKSMMRRDSSFGPVPGFPTGKTSWDASRDSQSLSGPSLSRFSMSSAGSHRASTDTIPPLPVAKDGSLLASRFSEDYDSLSSGRPSLSQQRSSMSVTPSISVHSDEEEDANADAQSISSNMTRRTMRGRPSSRLSVWSSKKDSDNASLLTVDEITEDLEKRRLSRTSWMGDNAIDLTSLADASADSDADASSQLGASAASVADADTSRHSEGLVDVDEEGEEEEENDEDDDEDDDEDEEEEEEEEEEAKDLDVPQTVTTTTKKSTFRWVKGALIGSGSFGQVYLGMNARLGSFMAVKQVELPTGSSHNEERKKSMLSALEREIELLKEIQHENIVQYLDSDSDGKHLFIFLEYVPGGSVAHLLANYGKFEEILVRTFVRQILRGLAYLHENDIIHRDIKGANILVDNRGGIKISDFGISKKVEENLLTGSNRMNRPSLQGSVFWMAPEVVKQTSYTAKADIWSLGCLIVEMFTGHHPWLELTQMQAIFKIGSAKDARPTIPPDFSADGQSFLDLAFKMDYNERPTAAELAKHPFSADEDA